jgi:MFS family permease
MMHSAEHRRRGSPTAPEGWELSTSSPGLAAGLLDGGGVDGRASPAAVARPRGEAAPSPASLRGLDWFSFFLADIQTGFGPFVAVYLTTQSWTQVDIGLILTAGGLVSLAGQMPGGALIDAMRSARLATGLAVVAICLSALAIAAWPIFPIVFGARALHAAASCILGPAIAAVSLGLVGHAAFGERIGRNARFASIGCGFAAAAMGACGHLISNQAVFLLTAIMVVPALVALARIRSSEFVPRTSRGLESEPGSAPSTVGLRGLLCNRRLLIFAGCLVLFQLANAAMLPLMGSMLAVRSSEWAATIIAGCMVMPQLVVAGIAPWVGRQAQLRGRRPLLLVCFVALAMRGLLFAFVTNTHVIVAAQVLDGVSAAILGIVFPLVVADITRDTGRFNLALGIVGSAIGIGASLSTTLAGYMLDRFGSGVTFCSLAGVAVAGVLLVLLLMPETRPEAEPGA